MEKQQQQTSAGVQSKTITTSLIAEDMAFDKGTITVPASAKVKIVFENRDTGIPHNFALYEDETAVKNLFKGKVITGPAKIEYEFTAPSTPGSYFFRCDIHPKMMTGSFIVEKS